MSKIDLSVLDGLDIDLNHVPELYVKGNSLDRRKLEKAVKKISHLRRNKIKIIGVCGSHGLGKTTLISRLPEKSLFLAPFATLKDANSDRFHMSKTVAGLQRMYRDLSKEKIKYIVIDESMTTLAQMIRWDKIKEDSVFRTLKAATNEKVCIILLDANMNRGHLNQWADFMGVSESESALVNDDDIIPNRGTYTGLTTDLNVFLGLLQKSLNKDTVSVVLCDTKKRCEELALAFKNNWRVCTITGGNDYIVSAYNKYKESIYNHEYDLIIGSPCCFEGISFDNTDKVTFGFNGVIVGEYTGILEPARRATQANVRVRNPHATRVIYTGNTEVVYSLDRKPVGLGETVEEIALAIKMDEFDRETLKNCAQYLRNGFNGKLLRNTPHFKYLAKADTDTKKQYSDLLVWTSFYLKESGYTPILVDGTDFDSMIQGSLAEAKKEAKEVRDSLKKQQAIKTTEKVRRIYSSDNIELLKTKAISDKDFETLVIASLVSHYNVDSLCEAIEKSPKNLYKISNQLKRCREAKVLVTYIALEQQPPTIDYDLEWDEYHEMMRQRYIEANVDFNRLKKSADGSHEARIRQVFVNNLIYTLSELTAYDNANWLMKLYDNNEQTVCFTSVELRRTGFYKKLFKHIKDINEKDSDGSIHKKCSKKIIYGLCDIGWEFFNTGRTMVHGERFVNYSIRNKFFNL